MSGAMNCATVAAIAADGLTELVRGNERLLLERIMPLVGMQNVSLDLGSVRRIDAAGLAALITLYCTAREAGYGFHVSNPAPRVEEILVLVGLDRILLSRNADQILYPGVKMEQTAA